MTPPWAWGSLVGLGGRATEEGNGPFPASHGCPREPHSRCRTTHGLFRIYKLQTTPQTFLHFYCSSLLLPASILFHNFLLFTLFF